MQRLVHGGEQRRGYREGSIHEPQQAPRLQGISILLLYIGLFSNSYMFICIKKKTRSYYN